MKKIMHNKSFTKNKDGSILLETAIIIPFLYIAFTGLINIAHMIDARESLNKAVNQTALVLGSTFPGEKYTFISGGTVDASKIIKVMTSASLPHDYSIAVAFCSKQEPSPGVYVINTVNNIAQGTGVCGFGPTSGGYQKAAACPATLPSVGPGRINYFTRFIVAEGSCRFHPQFLGGVFTGGINMDETVTMALRSGAF